MKPSWDDAPEWAKWLAMDANGIWYWHALEPKAMYETDDFWSSNGAFQQAGFTQNNWKDTSERRP